MSRKSQIYLRRLLKMKVKISKMIELY